MMLKTLGKAGLSRIFEAQVKQLRAQNDIQVIAVVGSVGKTTTKLAIAQLLAADRHVQYQAGNYNDRLTVPLVFFGQQQPGLYDAVGWFKTWWAQRRQLKQPYPYKTVVVELGSDGPGQLKHMAYLKPDVLVVSALTEEHMAYFKTLDAVAAEELSLLPHAAQTLINIDDSPAEYLANKQFLSYGTDGDFSLQGHDPQTDGRQTLHLTLQGRELSVTTGLLGLPGAKATLAAVAVASLSGMSDEVIAEHVPAITAVAGRMQLLSGSKGSVLIDDSYNASPVAVKAALDTLYALPNQQKIAVLGNMNEMGALSQGMHVDVGSYCDPERLQLVLTIGADANEHLAAAAEANGCEVVRCSSPYDAGKVISERMQPGAAVLVKGSQNGVFAEEALKPLLADPADAAKLVRQSPYWLSVKRQQFGASAAAEGQRHQPIA